ncbi:MULTISPECIES: zinc ribbon domain-containing protein [unclassified Colwellia]|uniref:zinc ribbon domain-containing protein n=1 Tax=unclassified Colwellia TaxID=196834 RepID=UPI0015F555D4|nr:MULTISPECIES: zinc ribbon domain-containing protein [unclassified Colwellia]MBA6379701.1 hypothetical protein [Colwellia sp. BRX10-7]MBA6388484.1 hypothetical protein [Colwellia sp. BRX10-2]MBA6403002.1 hypothetical protein [Colwellia sp. BRX10-5]MBA6406319.1 hypothetical protein [Colwellia sp. BRX10-1]
MSLINCPQCNHQVSSNAKKCPECAEPLKKSYFMKLLTLILIVIVLLLLFGSYYASSEKVSLTNAYGDINFDGTYDIYYASEPCQSLGFSFKKKHSIDGHSDINKMYKSYCKVNQEGNFEGYIYPKEKSFRHLRVFWVSNGNNVYYKN